MYTQSLKDIGFARKSLSAEGLSNSFFGCVSLNTPTFTVRYSVNESESRTRKRAALDFGQESYYMMSILVGKCLYVVVSMRKWSLKIY